jgi:primosomal protein N' (replication factor Y)
LIVHAARLVGRSESEGRIYLQTHTPDNALLLGLSKNNLTDYFASDSLRREMLKFPPFGCVAQVAGQGTKSFLESLSETLEYSAVVQTVIKDTELGLVRAGSWQELTEVLSNAKRPAKSRLTIHIDPPRI